MPSELAIQIRERIVATDQIAESVDAELQEVRDVLKVLVEVEDTELNDPNVSAVIIRTRALMARLNVGGAR